MNKARYHIGIDCGVNNGFAIFDTQSKRITEIATYKMYELLFRLVQMKNEGMSFFVRLENPNTWVNYNTLSVKQASSRKQGAGSVKRSFQVIEEMLLDYEIEYESVSLRSCPKKLKSDLFKKITGIAIRTNEHERDACMLVFKGAFAGSICYE